MNETAAWWAFISFVGFISGGWLLGIICLGAMLWAWDYE